MEHSPIGIAEAVSLLRAIAGTPAEPVVRLPWNDQIMVKRILDAGARNLMFPFVQSAEEARHMLGRFMSYGYDWGAVGSDLSLLTGRAVEWVTAIKGGSPQ
jgi:hypothetical protein